MRYCLGSEQELLSMLSVIEVCQDSRNFLMRKFPLSLIDAIVEVNDVVLRPSMIGNSGAFGRCLHVPNMFFFPRGKGSACFANVIPRATATGIL